MNTPFLSDILPSRRCARLRRLGPPARVVYLTARAAWPQEQRQRCAWGCQSRDRALWWERQGWRRQSDRPALAGACRTGSPFATPIPAGKSSARPETGPAFLATNAYCAVQRPGSLAPSRPKPRKPGPELTRDAKRNRRAPLAVFTVVTAPRARVEGARQAVPAQGHHHAGRWNLSALTRALAELSAGRGRSLQASSEAALKKLIYRSSRILLRRRYRCQRVANAL
jgi:hypothetical protein